MRDRRRALRQAGERREQHRVIGFQGLDRQGDAQVRFPDAWRAEQHNIAIGFDKRQFG
jgi:hypothetical protein